MTMEAYANKLAGVGVPTRKVIEATALHRWIAAA